MMALEELRNKLTAGQTEPNYTPRGDRVIVKRLDRPKPVALLDAPFLSDSQEKPFCEGIVRYVGPGTRHPITGELQPITDLKPGMHVCFVEFVGTEEEVDGEMCLVMRDVEVYAIRNNSPEPQYEFKDPISGTSTPLNG